MAKTAADVLVETLEAWGVDTIFGPRKAAVAFAQRFADESGVSWLEEPAPPENLADLKFVRDHAPPTVEIAEGEYGYTAEDFRRLLAAEATDVVMPDATRCGGVTGFLHAAGLCAAWGAPASSHCAPSVHAHLGCAAPGVRHLEYFHDHARIEQRFFEGAPVVVDGALQPDRSRAGLGLQFKWSDASDFAV